jgi:hypothetical protein
MFADLSTGMMSVQDSDSSLDFGRRDLVLLNFLIKRTSRDPESLRGFLNPPALLVQDPFDVLLLELDERQASIQKRCAHLRMTVEVKVVESDIFLVTQQHCSFDNVTQFADVTGPGIRLKQIQRLFAYSPDVLS